VLPVLLPLRDQLPTRTYPFVNYALIAMNVAVFVLEETAFASGVTPEALTFTWGLVPARLVADPTTGFETVFSSMFMHGGFQHIAGNMLFLWIFGDNVEDAMGHLRYLAFYLAGGICAAAAHVLIDPTSTVPLVGASGAIASVLAAYMLLYPQSPITVLNPVPPLWLFFGFFLHLPAWLVIAEFFVINLWDVLANASQGGIAFMAHVGGFIGGIVLCPLFMAGRARLDDYARWQRLAERRRVGRGTW